MGFACGIIGLPNVGKSTLFNALTASRVEAANYPFCTIEPNTGIVKVPDIRLEHICNIIHPENIIPASMTFVDIAGLVKGASQGEGLGNQFLGHIRETQAIAHVVRCFENSNVVHVNGAVDPIGDIHIIDTELMLADLDTVQKRLNTLQKSIRSGTDKKARAQYSILEHIKKHLEAGTPIRQLPLSTEEIHLIHDLHLITAKKVMYIGNIDENPSASTQKHLNTLIEFAKKESSPVIPICSTIESEIAELSPEERLLFLQDLNMSEPGLNKVIQSGYALLGLITYFTAGKVEVRAWTIPDGFTAPQAAGVIHSDFEKGFIKAETYHYRDLMQFKSEQAIRDAGLLRLEGKQYIVKDGDIMHFRFAV